MQNKSPLRKLKCMVSKNGDLHHYMSLSTFLYFEVRYSFIRIPEGCGYCKISLYSPPCTVWIKLPLLHLVIKLNNSL